MLEAVSKCFLDWEHKRRVGDPAPELVRAYEERRDEIERVLADTELYHGTGRYRYLPKDGSKYNGIVSSEDGIHLLATVLEEGLRPQEDLFAEVFTGKDQPSISLTHLRMYARIYANLFEESGNGKLSYEYGSQSFWWQYLGLRMVLNMFTDPEWYSDWIANIKIRLFEKEESEHRLTRRKLLRSRMDGWQRTFRHDDKYDGLPHHLMCFGKSTIPENHGAIVGVAKGAVQPLPILHGYVRRYEVRSGQAVNPDQFTYLEVPEAVVEQTRALVADSSFPDLPVIPMELMELHHQQKPFASLTAPHPDTFKSRALLVG